MLSNITWTEFLAGLFLITLLYYVYVMFRYYPEQLKRMLGRTAQTPQSRMSFISDEMVQQEFGKTEEEELMQDQSDLDEIEELISKLLATISTASEKQLDQSELKWSLELLLREKPSLKHSPYRPSINVLIVSECEKNGTYSLSEKDVDKMWE